MKKFFTTHIGRLRLVGFLEGLSLILLVGIAVPLKYVFDDPLMVKALGPIHGFLFLLFVVNTLIVGVAYKWKFSTTGWVLASCMIPFATFYVDKTILSKVGA